MRAFKIVLAVAALAFTMGAMPGTASADESSLTEATMSSPASTTCHESGLTRYCKTVQSGQIPCSGGWICLFTDADYRGVMFSWPAGNHHPNFARIPGLNDAATSWVNNTSILYCINWDAAPGLNNDMPPMTKGGYLGDVWNDQASALSSSGC
ncbi:peptidase inhibitor family I36 protein [Amycolatopsis nigrescens]|uniref:peptidase inhibitor family I36 protein n=1 Tax=Amycolatopsis nigrescens TaxID=381445 RepID=UPI0003782263|nr:peptidase inhibitor family I36 protein [Amycolatopsis nigrescens]